MTSDFLWAPPLNYINYKSCSLVFLFGIGTGGSVTSSMKPISVRLRERDLSNKFYLIGVGRRLAVQKESPRLEASRTGWPGL